MPLLSFGGAPQALNEVFNFGRQLFLLPTAAVLVLFLESDLNTPRESRALVLVLTAGALLGLAWLAQELSVR